MWIYPTDVIPYYHCGMDLWAGSPGYGYDAVNDEPHYQRCI